MAVEALRWTLGAVRAAGRMRRDAIGDATGVPAPEPATEPDLAPA